MTPDGSPNLGSIPKINEKFPAGVIRANAGAVQRSERIHGKDIRAKHYDNAQTLLLDVLNNYTAIYPGDDNSSIFLTIQGDSKHLAKSVITRIRAENGYYKVKDMGITKTRNFENKTPLYTRSTSPVIGSDSNLAISSRERTRSEVRGLNARQSSDNQSVPSNGLNVNNVERYNQIIGEKGAQELDKQEGNTYRMDNLAVAKEMTAERVPAKIIRMATGWELDKTDKKWRWEIMDGEFQWQKVYKRIQSGVKYPEHSLTEIFKNDELYKAYPELENTEVMFLDLRGADFSGQYNPDTKNIIVNLYMNPDQIQSTLIHEVQHAIQDIEGFAFGGNKEMFEDDVISLEKLENKLEQLNDKLKHESNESERDKLERQIEELEARIDEVEENALDGMVEVDNNVYDDTHDAYHHLAGEAEARNAQRRRKFTAEARRKTKLTETLDTDKPLIERYNQILGEKGAAELDKQEGNTQRMDNLAVAKKMSKAGKDAKTIRLATGWELDKTDKKWRWEIMDGKFKDNLSLSTDFTENGDIYAWSTLGEVLDAPELFKAYPELKDIQVSFTMGKDFEHDGGFYPTGASFFEDGIIDVKGAFNAGDTLNPSNHNNALSTLLHEVQHFVQNIEGVSFGSNPISASYEYWKKDPVYLAWDQEIQKIEPEFLEMKKELEKRHFTGYNPDDTWSRPAFMDYDEDDMRFQLENSANIAPDEVEKFSRFPYLRDRFTELQNLLHNYEQSFSDEATLNMYLNNPGEKEARNVQKRLKLTAEQRRKTLLSETVDNDIPINEKYNQAMRSEDDEDFNVKEQIEAVRKQYQNTDKWLKAPNGKKSNLTEKQWLQVRTENFKKWFGNWEAPAIKERLTNGDMVFVEDDGNELIKGQETTWHELVEAYSKNQPGAPKQLLDFLRKLIPETITNVNIGDIGFTNNSLRNSLHHKNGRANAIVLPYIH